MSEGEDIKIRFGDAFEDWMAAANNPRNDGNDIFIISPFITGSVISQIFDAARANQHYVITALKPDSILAGSLEVKALCELHDRGVKLFNIENLHSKVLYYGHDLIIGSQNFTRGGRRNFETSVRVPVQNNLVGDVIEFINNTIENSSRLTIDEIKTLSESTAELEEEYKKIRRAFKEAEKKITERKISTDKEKQSAAVIATELMKLCQSQYIKSGNWVKIERKKFSIPEREGDFYYSFVRTRTKMELNSFVSVGAKKRHTLQHQKRYLGLNLHNLQPFWLPANKTQIAKFSREREIGASYDGVFIRSIKLVDPYEHHAFANVLVDFKLADGVPQNASLFFDGMKLLVRNTERAEHPITESFLKTLKSLMFEPFDYEYKSTGEQPNRYFKKGKYYNLSLLEFEAYHFMALSERLDKNHEAH